MKSAEKIILGGGKRGRSGYVNIDILKFPEVDIVHDINKGIPLDSNSVSEIIAHHVLEHIPDTIHVFEEMYRVSKPNAIIKIKVPYFKSIGAFKDPTHVSFFTEKTFEYFNPESKDKLPDYKTKCSFRTDKLTYIWQNKFIRFLPFKRSLFLKYFWNIARTMYVELRVLK